MTTLTETGVKVVLEAYKDAIKCSIPEVRAEALQALLKSHKIKDGTSVLIEIVLDPKVNDEVRLDVIQAFKKLTIPLSNRETFFQVLLQDTKPEIVAAALDLLAQHSNNEASNLVIKLVHEKMKPENEDMKIRLKAAKAAEVIYLIGTDSRCYATI